MNRNGLYALTLGLAASVLQGCFDTATRPDDTQATAAAVAAAAPDLIFTAAAITSQTATQVKYSYTIKNQGTAGIASLYNVSIQNFYSANTIFNDAGDVAAGGAILGVNIPLAAGASYSGTFYASGAVPAGKPWVTFKIDWGGIVAESNETNNTRALNTLADLRFTAAAVTGSTATQVKYSYTIKNEGTRTIPDLYNVSIQNFYSANTIFNDAGDVPAGGAILGVHAALAPGASYSGNFYASGAVPAGKTYVTFKIDWGNIVVESDENDNTYFLVGAPDLYFSSVTITGKTPTQVQYTYTIRNGGTVAIPDIYNVSIQNFYSANTVFNDAGDVAAGGRILGVHQSLAPGATYTANYYASGAVPANHPYLTAKIDWGSIITEHSETNNTFARLIP